MNKINFVTHLLGYKHRGYMVHIKWMQLHSAVSDIPLQLSGLSNLNTILKKFFFRENYI